MPKALLIVDHGSTRVTANRMLEDVAEVLRRKRPDLIVEFAHMELAEPNIEQAFGKCVKAGATEVIVHPYMLSPGRHASKDIPILASKAAKRFPRVKWRCTKPLGLHEKIGDVVLERAGLL